MKGITNTQNLKGQNLGPAPNRAAFVVNLFRPKVKGIGVEDLSIDDVVVAVMGPTGSGKSTFIETVTGVTGIAGHGLQSYTAEISIVRLSLSGLNLCFVDTPGFDDTNRSDYDIFKMISDWIISTYKKRIRLAGLLYFHRISDNRMAGTPLKNLQVFEKLCGESFDRLVLTTTMWSEVEEKVGAERERELKEMYWKSMVERGSPVKRFLSTRESAFEILTPIFDEVYRRSALLLHREMGELSLHLNKTSAGKALDGELDELVSRHRDIHGKIRSNLKDPTVDSGQLQILLEEHQKVSMELQRTTEDVRRMNIPNPDRVYRVVTIVDWTRLFNVFSLNQNAREVEEKDDMWEAQAKEEMRIWKARTEKKEQESEVWMTWAKRWEDEAREKTSKEREIWEARLKQLEQDAKMREKKEDDKQLWEARSKQWEKEAQVWEAKEREAREREKNEREAKEKETKERETKERMWEARVKQLEQDARAREKKEGDERRLWEARSKEWEKEAQMWVAKEKEYRERARDEREAKTQLEKELAAWKIKAAEATEREKLRSLREAEEREKLIWEARETEWEKLAQILVDL